MNGIIVRYNQARGFGFLSALIGKPKQAPDLYFHVTAVRGGIPPPVGAEVSFIVVRGNDGRPQAADIELVEMLMPVQKQEPQHAGRS